MYQNISFVLVLLCLGFYWQFHDAEARLSLEATYLHFGVIRDGLHIIDLDVSLFNLNVITSLHNHKNDVNVWYARLANIVCKGLQKKVCQ